MLQIRVSRPSTPNTPPSTTGPHSLFILYRYKLPISPLKNHLGKLSKHSRLKLHPPDTLSQLVKEGRQASVVFKTLLAAKFRTMLDTSWGPASMQQLCLCPARPSVPPQFVLSPFVKILSVLKCSSKPYLPSAGFVPWLGSFPLKTFIGLDSSFSCALYFGTFCTTISWVFAYVQDQKLREAGSRDVVIFCQALGGYIGLCLQTVGSQTALDLHNYFSQTSSA